MKTATKIVLAALAIAVLCVGGYQLYITAHFRLYDGYRDDLPPAYEYAEAAPFKALGDASPNVPGNYVLAAESGNLKLYAEPDTGNVALYDKSSGRALYSNPPEAAEDPIANPVNREILQSQFTLTFFDTRGNVAEYSSYAMATAAGQVSAESIPGGVRFLYTLGNTRPKAGILPLFVTEERLDEVLSGIEDERTRGLVKRRWEASDKKGVMKLTDMVKNNPSQQTAIIDFFEQLGYTDEDRIRDQDETEVEIDGNIGFIVPLEYVIEDGSLVAGVPAGHIVETGGAKVESIKLLPFFGAGSSGDEGYLVVPNGSGSVINFNNGKTGADDYRQYVYAQDLLLSKYAVLGSEVQARMPVWGVWRNGASMFAEIESGAPLAQINAAVSGKLNSYNYAYAQFVLRGALNISMVGGTGNESEIPIVEVPKADVMLKVRYTPLPEGYEGYSGMARYERERLLREGVLKAEQSAGDVPFFYNLIGSTAGQKFFLDISYRGQIPMTTYKQAAAIYGDLLKAGITNQHLTYQGWFNRGYYHDVASKIKPVSQLGSVKELEKLAADVTAGGGAFYSDTLFNKVPFTSEGHGYNWVYETSRYYGGGMVAGFGEVNPRSYYMTASFGYTEIMYDVLSPKFLTRYVEKFLKAFDKYDLAGVALRDLGDVIASDRKRTEMVNRAEAESIIAANLERLSKYPLSVSGGNFYAWKYADTITNAPMSDNKFFIVDEEIPFYQMIIHGSIDYAGGSINLSDSYDENEITLRLLEFGASPSFTFTAEPSGDMKYTGLNAMYSTTFANWSGTAERIYANVNSVLSKVRGSGVKSHAILSEYTRRVEYDNGCVLYVNYGKTPETADGYDIPASGYIFTEAAR